MDIILILAIIAILLIGISYILSLLAEAYETGDGKGIVGLRNLLIGFIAVAILIVTLAVRSLF